jgi:hypothetical protein
MNLRILKWINDVHQYIYFKNIRFQYPPPHHPKTKSPTEDTKIDGALL